MTDANESAFQVRKDTEAMVVAYAMSRLDDVYLASRGASSWTDAFREATQALNRPPNTFKNLRDEFDPFFKNARQGWHKRSMRPARQRVMDELEDVSNAALLALVDRILANDESVVAEAVDSMAVKTKIAYNVAERLLTGRTAENYFLEHCQRLVNLDPRLIVDLRNAAAGYDFGSAANPSLAYEIKGLKQTRGVIQFTDCEWAQAEVRAEEYFLVVVGNLDTVPVPRVFRNPRASLTASCSYQTSVSAVWRSTVSVLPQQ